MIPVTVCLLCVRWWELCSQNKIEMKYFFQECLSNPGVVTAPILFSAILTNPLNLPVSPGLRCHSPWVPAGSGCGLSCPIWMKASWRAGRQPWNKYCVMWIITLWENNTCLTSSTMGGGWCYVALWGNVDTFFYLSLQSAPRCVFYRALSVDRQSFVPPQSI